jgi:F-type H+-transporting ATPase subunit delta
VATLARDVAGRRYALAMIELAREQGGAEGWLAAAEGLEALTSEPSFGAALQGDGMTDERFAAIVRQAVPGIAQDALNLFRLLRRKGRLGLGPSIASYVRELWDEEQGVQRAEVRTAVPLDEGAQERIRARLAAQTGKTIVLESAVDPALLGGAVIRLGDRLIDGSTRTRLRQLRERLQQGSA